MMHDWRIPKITRLQSGNILTVCQSANLPILRTLLLLLALAVAPLVAADWPQFLGPARNGVYPGPALNEKWPASSPRLAWRKQVGEVLSGPVLAQNRLILFHRLDDREVVDSFDADTAAAQWRHAYPTTYTDDSGFDEGP